MSRRLKLTLLSCALVLGTLVLWMNIHQTARGPQPLSPEMAEIQALCSAIEAYKVDHDSYPSNPNITDTLVPNTTFDPDAYVASSAFLYRALAGDPQNNLAPPGTKLRRYFVFQPKMLRTSSRGHPYIVDQWGNSYGYSTFGAKQLDNLFRSSDHPNLDLVPTLGGYNPSFDLWSTSGGRTRAAQPDWIKNW